MRTSVSPIKCRSLVALSVESGDMVKDSLRYILLSGCASSLLEIRASPLFIAHEYRTRRERDNQAQFDNSPPISEVRKTQTIVQSRIVRFPGPSPATS